MFREYKLKLAVHQNVLRKRTCRAVRYQNSVNMDKKTSVRLFKLLVFWQTLGSFLPRNSEAVILNSENTPLFQKNCTYSYREDMNESDGVGVNEIYSSKQCPLNFSSASCRLKITGDTVGVLRQMPTLLENAKLLEYDIIVMNSSNEARIPNPLLHGNKWTYRGNRWSRVVTTHGQTILNLPFNYYMMSLMTLQYGIIDQPLQVIDEPYACLDNLTEHEKVFVVLNLILRDLHDHGTMQVSENMASVCHQVIVDSHNSAKFTENCCFASNDGLSIQCVVDYQNSYLNFLNNLLITVKVLVILFGPLILPDWVYAAAYDQVKYYVKLKKPLTKTIAIVNKDDLTTKGIARTHTIDLRHTHQFRLCKRFLASMPSNRIIQVTIPQYNIQVSEKKLLTEDKVQVGVVESVGRAIFMCKMSENDAFKDCCQANLCGCVHKYDKPWIGVCSVFGRVMLVLCLPIPLYVRFFFYYLFEKNEMELRKLAAANVGLPLYFDYNVLQYFTPLNPVFIIAYCIYFAAGGAVAFFGGTDRKTKFQQAVMDAFSDLNNLSMLNAVGVLINNFLWPFTKYGVYGVFIGVFAWPLLLPISVFFCALYCIPLVFVSVRMVRHVFADGDDDDDDVDVKRELRKPKPERYRANTLLSTFRDTSRQNGYMQGAFSIFGRWGFFREFFLSTSAILALFVIMFALGEVLHFFIQTMCYTLMGIIVNASTVLKYGSLIFLVVLYSYDCYNNVTVKYLKLNKALFSEIKFRLIKEIEEFTQLPSDIQENRGFKAVESSDQAEYEMEDDVTGEHCKKWTINDLILFIDREDCPRIPKKLFEEVCDIKTAGSPGPVYLSLIAATKKFLIILLFLAFVFLVVLSFGQSYNVSQTNQALATMAGGFMPFMFRNIFKPKTPKVETGLLSFRSKLEEIIKNFKHDWFMHDFVMDVVEPKEEEEEKEGEKKEKDQNDKEKDKNDNNKKDKKDEKEKDKDWLQKIQRIKSIDIDSIEKNLEKYEPLEAAVGQTVDIVFIFTEADIDWRYSNSDIDTPLPDSEMRELSIPLPKVTVNGSLLDVPDPHERTRRASVDHRKMTMVDPGYFV